MRLSEQAKWMVRNVCQANPSIRTAYPELFAVIGGKVPDYRDWFLRGGTAGQAGDEAQDSIRSHVHELTEHAHTLSIKDAASKDDVASMTPIYDTVNVGGISGVPTMKVCFSGFNDDIYRINFDDVYYLCPKYGVYNTIRVGRVLDYKDKNFTVHCGFPFTMYFEYRSTIGENCSVSITRENQEYMCTAGLFRSPGITATLQTQDSGTSSSITYVSGMKMAPGSSAVSGTTDPGGAGQTRETGGVETAPKHKFVRYFIRARP